MADLLAELGAARRRWRFRGDPRGAHIAAMMRTRTIYVHVPKCGGKSIISGFYGLGVHDGFGHAEINLYRALLGPRRFREYTKFTVMRDPIARCLSAYHFGKRGGFGGKADQGHAHTFATMSFEEFVLNGTLDTYFTRHTIFKPQAKFICGPDGAVLVDHICRLETLEADLRAVLGRSFDHFEIPKMNMTDYDRSPSLDPAVINKLKDLYARDYEILAQSRPVCAGRGDAA